MQGQQRPEKALVENYNLKTTIDTMKTRECSKANAMAMRGLAEGTENVKRVKGRKVEEYDTDEEIELMEAEMKVMKLRKQGKFSSRRQGEDKKKCRNCNLVHIEGEECSAKGKTCYKCEGQDHYARAPACPKSRTRGREEKTTKKVTEKTTDSDTDSISSDSDIRRVESMTWPGTAKSARPRVLRRGRRRRSSGRTDG